MGVSTGPSSMIKITVAVNGVGGFTTEQAEHIKKWVDEAYAKGYKDGMSVNTFTTATPPIYPYPIYDTPKVGDDPNYFNTITCDMERGIK